MRHKAILVDGPERGRVVELEGSRFAVPVPKVNPFFDPENPLTGMPFEPEFRTVIYEVYRIALFGRLVHVGSVRERPRDVDLFEALASNTAKDLVTP